IIDGGARSLDHRLMVVGGDQSANVSERVDVVTLEEAVQLAGVDQVDLLKMDIEGAEFDVFFEATPSVLRHFRRIALEYHDNLRPGTLAMLRERLASTHTIVSIDSSPEGYGIIQASLREH